MLEQIAHGPVQRVAVVHAGAEHDLRVRLNSHRRQTAQLFADVGSAAVAQHSPAQLELGRVDRDVQWAEPLLLEPLPVVLAEVGQRDEVAVQEGEPIVVVLQIERAAQSFWQPLEEAEEAGVVADARAVEGVVRELDAERLVDRFLELDDARLAVVDHVQRDEAVGGLEAVVELVARRFAVDPQHAVAGLQPRLLRERVGLDRGDGAAAALGAGHLWRAPIDPVDPAQGPAAASWRPISSTRLATASIEKSGVDAPAVTPTSSWPSNHSSHSSSAVSTW